MKSAEGHLNGPFRVPQIGMADDICKRLVDGKNHRAAIRLRESKLRRELAQALRTTQSIAGSLRNSILSSKLLRLT